MIWHFLPKLFDQRKAYLTTWVAGEPCRDISWTPSLSECHDLGYRFPNILIVRT
jgi:hypothetical protein